MTHVLDLSLDGEFPDLPHGRPAWLMTLADLALLLVGFFVFVQASGQLDGGVLAHGIRAGFGVRDAVVPAVAISVGPVSAAPVSAAPVSTAPVSTDAMAVSAGVVRGFAPGSARLPQLPDAIVAWVRDAARDARVNVRVSGAVDGSAGDVDPLTGAGAVLAADRARAVATALLSAHAVSADRIAIAPAGRTGRAVTITTGFAGGRQ